jgi:hypothetical protein
VRRRQVFGIGMVVGGAALMPGTADPADRRRCLVGGDGPVLQRPTDSDNLSNFSKTLPETFPTSGPCHILYSSFRLNPLHLTQIRVQSSPQQTLESSLERLCCKRHHENVIWPRVAPGRRILVLAEEYPSGIYTRRRAARHTGTETLTVTRQPDQDWTQAILTALDETVAVVRVPNAYRTDGTLNTHFKKERRARSD